VQNQDKANEKKKALGKGLQESYLKELGRAKQIMVRHTKLTLGFLTLTFIYSN